MEDYKKYLHDKDSFKEFLEEGYCNKKNCIYNKIEDVIWTADECEKIEPGMVKLFNFKDEIKDGVFIYKTVTKHLMHDNVERHHSPPLHIKDYLDDYIHWLLPRKMKTLLD